jgi:lysozyme
MSDQTPPSKPRASLTVVRDHARTAWEKQNPGKALPETFVLMNRAYYDATMGRPGNDVGMYDDAAFIVSPLGFTSWNANTDPSRYGWNPGAGKYMARLKPGVYRYRRLKHHASRPDGYMAFGQGDSPVTVERIREDGTIARSETGCFGINLHRGGINGTSSEGCMTIPTGQWPAFDQTLAGILKNLSTSVFTLILIEGAIA